MEYTIEENSNYLVGEGNLFLMRNGKCIGGADKERTGADRGKWIASINKAYDPESDSDVEIIGWYATQAEARQALLDCATAYNL